MSQYADFEIAIGAPVDDAYAVGVRSLNGAQTDDTLVLPVGDARYVNFQTKVEYARSTVTEEDVLDLGALLHESLFKGKVWAAFVAARDDAARDGKVLRIKLSIDPKYVAVATFPWEFACNDAGIPLATKHSFCRFLPRFDPYPALKVAPNTKLKLLLTSAMPAELAEKHSLNIDAEVAAIRLALKPLEDAGRLSIVEVAHLTGPKLDQAISDEKPHILHYVGHGSFEGETGSLVLEQANGSRKDFSARQLAVTLDGSSVRLVILNACKTGMVVNNLLRGMAPALMAVNIPAVVAMQSSVQDEAGLAFATAFYRTLAKGEPVDGCVAAGRKAVIACGINQLDWGLATLYMRAPDGMLFEGLEATGTAAPAATGAAVPASAPAQPAQPAGEHSSASIDMGSGNQYTGANITIGPMAGKNITQGNSTTYGGSSPVGSPAPTTAEPDRRKYLIELRNIKKQELYELRLKEAKFGSLYVPSYLSAQLRDTSAELAQIESELQQLGG